MEVPVIVELLNADGKRVTTMGAALDEAVAATVTSVRILPESEPQAQPSETTDR